MASKKPIEERVLIGHNFSQLWSIFNAEDIDKSPFKFLPNFFIIIGYNKYQGLTTIGFCSIKKRIEHFLKLLKPFNVQTVAQTFALEISIE